MDNAGIQYRIENMKSLIRLAAFSSRKAHDVLFKEDSHDFKQQIFASMYISDANSLICAAKAIYHSNFEDLCNDNVEDIFNSFDVYKNEFLDSFRTDHAHQWTDIEYRKFAEDLKSLDILILSEVDK